MTQMVCTHPGCGAPIKASPRRKTTLCHRHAAAQVARDPARNAKIAATVKAGLAVPGVLRARSAAISAAFKVKLRDPVVRQAYREMGARLGKLYGGVQCSPEMMKIKAERARATRLAHVPLEYRELYMDLSRDPTLLADERLRLIHDQMARDQQRYARDGKLQQSVKEGRR